MGVGDAFVGWRAKKNCDFSRVLVDGKTNTNDFIGTSVAKLNESYYVNYRNKYALESSSVDIIAMCAFAEVWNGLGYYNQGYLSPYIYSGTDIYISGKYDYDGHYNGSLVDNQPGIYILLKTII
jgi:hypothetical protein